MTEKEAKSLCRSIDGLTKAVKDNSKLNKEIQEIISYGIWVAAYLGGYTMMEDGTLEPTDCSCPDCQCESEKVN